jgi:glutamine cyclotransferase
MLKLYSNKKDFKLNTVLIRILNPFYKGISIIVLISIVLAGCDNTKEQPKSPRIRNFSKVISPLPMQSFTTSDSVVFSAANTTDSVSVVSMVLMNGMDTISKASGNELKPQIGATTGIPNLNLYIQLSNGTTESYQPKIVILAEKEPDTYTYELINTYPHDPDAYTQGLLYYKGELYESTGQQGESVLRRVEIKTGKPLVNVNIKDTYFGEGLAQFEDKLYQLTWKSNICLVYDLGTMTEVSTFTYQTEGWGITATLNSLVMSDGTENLYVKDPETFADISKLQVYDNKGPIDNLNELEYANGLIFANVYQTETIVIIDPFTGSVVGKLDLTGIFNKANYGRRIDVLNGIAHNYDSDTYFVTGKYWPKMFEIRISKSENSKPNL